MTGIFNNREIATGVWVVVLIAWALTKADVRDSFKGVIRAFFTPKVCIPVFCMMLYVAACVTLLASVKMWNVSLLKDTMLWFCASAMAMMMHFMTSKDVDKLFRKVISGSITIIVIIEFLTNTYTFSLPTELVLFPLLALIVMTNAYAGHNEEHSAVAKLTGRLQVLIGFAIVAVALARAVSDISALGSWDTVRNIALAPLLSILLVPCLYMMVLWSSYEQLFIRVDMGPEKEKKLVRYARRRIFLYAGFSTGRADQLLKNHALDLMHLKTLKDVDQLLQ